MLVMIHLFSYSVSFARAATAGRGRHLASSGIPFSVLEEVCQLLSNLGAALRVYSSFSLISVLLLGSTPGLSMI